MGLICFALRLVSYSLLAWIILGYVAAFGRLPWGHPIRKVYDFLSRAFEPLLAPIRKVLPPVRIGNAGLDLSPLVIWIGIALIIEILPC